MRRRKNRFYRWIATMLTVALLAGQCDIAVLAKESTVSQGNDISGEKKEEGKGGGASDSVDSDGKGDDASKKDGEGDSTENAGDDGSGNSGAEGGSVDDGAGDAGTGDGGDSDGAGEDETGDGNNSDDEGAENGSGASDSENDGSDGDENTGGEGGSGNGGADDAVTGDEDVDHGEEDGQEKCVCETACSAENVNEECPVCAADYSACAKNTGGGVKPPVETVSGNELDGEEEIALAADGAAARAVGEEFEDAEGIKYRVIDDGQVEVIGHKDGTATSGKLVIPVTIDDGKGVYRVTSIGERAFYLYQSLTDIDIPSSVMRIERDAFHRCNNLKSVDIPDGVTVISNGIFAYCDSLSNIKIPDGVTSIEQGAFAGCTGLNSIEIPVGVTCIEEGTFAGCHSLSNVQIFAGITSIGKQAFVGCKSLKTIKIIINSDKGIEPPEVYNHMQNAFAGTPNDRSIVFASEDGSEVNRDLLKVSQAAYKSDARDGDATDDLWWGWKIGDVIALWRIIYHLDGYTPLLTYTYYHSGSAYGLPVPQKSGFVFDGWYKTADYLGDKVDIIGGMEAGDKEFYGRWIGNAYAVQLSVNKNNEDWSDHNRTFALKEDDSDRLITDLSQVPNGTYNIYDMTGINPDSYYSKAVDTGRDVKVDGVDTNVDVTVQGAAAEATVYYYTVTFYDGATQYPAGTPQAQQTVLRGHCAEPPAEPAKAGYRFTGWKTRDGGATDFDFKETVNEKTRVYAGWEAATAAETVTITATAGTGGTITPSGEVSVNKGDLQAFQITANKGYHLKSVTVDDKDVTAAVTEAKGVYTFTDVNENHTITAVFEADTKKPSGSKPGGDKKPDDRKTKDNNGSSDGGSTGETQTVSVVQTAAPSTLNSVASAVPASESEGTMPGKEPQTADPTPVEVYATVAMIAGLTYLLLYFMEEGRGMSEREKEVFVAAFIRWAKKGGRFRRCCAVMAIFCILVYYHSIGKRAHEKNFSGGYLKQAL